MHGMTGLVAGLGISALTALGLSPDAQSRQVALIVPPWAEDGLQRAAGTGLAIMGTHWRHHVIILDTGGDPAALARLRATGLWLVRANGAALCRTEAERG